MNENFLFSYTSTLNLFTIRFTNIAQSFGPTLISVGIYYNSLIEINVAAGYSVIDFYASYQWNDTRLSLLYNSSNFIISTNTIWNPSFEYLNVIEITKIDDDTVTFYNDTSTVYWSVRYIAQFSIVTYLSQFPFDTVILVVKLSSDAYPSDQVVYEADTQFQGLSQFVSLEGWNLINYTNGDTLYLFGPENANYTLYEFKYIAIRNPEFFFWRIGVTTLLIVIIACAVLFMEPTDLVSRIATIASCILALIANTFAISGLIPAIPYLSKLDIFLFLSSLMVFFLGLESTFVAIYDRRIKRRYTEFRKSSISSEVDLEEFSKKALCIKKCCGKKPFTLKTIDRVLLIVLVSSYLLTFILFWTNCF